MILEIMGSMLGKEIVSEGTKSLYENVAGILSYHLPEVQQIINDIDINNDIKIINNLIKEVRNNDINSPTFDAALNSIDEILASINNEIKNIETEIINHKQKWFNTWRTPNYSKNITTLKNMKSKLNNRLDNLVKITQVLNNLNINDASSIIDRERPSSNLTPSEIISFHTSLTDRKHNNSPSNPIITSYTPDSNLQNFDIGTFLLYDTFLEKNIASTNLILERPKSH